ncbi:MAG: tripartite tricarboxylate transporter TctB family protein, partial [Oscillospiraceae bacterium]
ELDYKRFLPFLGALALYVFLLQPLGYVISTFLFLFATFQIMKKGSYLKSTIIAATFSGGVYFLYVVVAKGTLPPMPFLNI